MLDNRPSRTIASIQYVVLYKVKEPDTTYYYLEPQIFQELSYRKLHKQGWRNAKVGNKKECNRFLEFVKNRKGIVLIRDDKKLPAISEWKSYQTA